MAATVPKPSKRKSTESTDQLVKKVKLAKSADRPAPLKSALKKSKDVDAAPTEKVTKKPSKKSEPAPETKKSKPAAEEELLDSDDEQGGGSTLTADQTAALLAGFSSSEEEEDEEKEEGIPISKLPKAPVNGELATTDADSTPVADPETTPGVIYVGRVPHGFYEHQMRAYFSQFGKITHLRLARSKKTARSKHYAFIEFASAAVADIVAKTMDKYLLFNHILQVRRVASEQIKENIWNGEKKKRPVPLNRIEGARLKRGTTTEGWEKRIEKENKKRRSNADKLKEIGYEFVAPALKSLSVSKQIEAPAAEPGPDQQLLEDIQSATSEAEVESAAQKVKTKKRAAGTGESKKTKKSKVKA